MNHSADSNQISSSFSDELDSDYLQTSSRSESDGNEVLLKSLEENWFQPEPLLTGNHRSAEFPIECLPLILQEAVVETCTYTQVPIAFACSSALGVAAASVQHLALVARDEQTIGPVSLYMLSILRSGERKSTIFRMLEKGFKLRQDELVQEFKARMTNSNQSANVLPESGRMPRILFEDVTTEALSLDISQGIKSVLLSSSEGAAIFGGIGMQGEALMGAMAFLNKAWDSEAQAMTRKQAASSYLDHYRLSCLISTQIETINEWLRKSITLAEGMGFLARFLISIPESTIGQRVYMLAPSNTPKLDSFVQCSIKHLKTPSDLENPKILRLSPEAHKLWVCYYDHIEKAQAKGGDYEDHTAAASKSAEQAARIAGVYALFGKNEIEEVGAVDMEMAIHVARWFLDESLRLSAQMGMTKAHLNASLLLEWLKNLKEDGHDPLKMSDLLRIGPRRIRSLARRNEAVEILIKQGWIQVKTWKNKKIILRHPSIRNE